MSSKVLGVPFEDLVAAGWQPVARVHPLSTDARELLAELAAQLPAGKPAAELQALVELLRGAVGAPAALTAFGIMAVSALWPVVVPVRLYKTATGKLHVCEGVREARRLGLPVYTDV